MPLGIGKNLHLQIYQDSRFQIRGRPHVQNIGFLVFFFTNQDFVSNRLIDDPANTLGHSQGTGDMLGHECGQQASPTRLVEASDRHQESGNIIKIDENQQKSTKTNAGNGNQ